MTTSSLTPVVDIICLVHDCAGFADLAIRSVEAHTKNLYRLVIVDSGSKEQATFDMLNAAAARGHTVLHLAENKSFSAGINAGAAICSAPFLCVINSDVICLPGWDTALLQDAVDKTVGLVGARSNFAAGHQGNPGAIGEPPWLVFVTVAMRRKVWDEIGGMDSAHFDGFSSEDVDFSWSVLKRGYKLKVSNAYVLHAGSQTLAVTQGDAEARARNDARYNQVLIDKWGKEWCDAHSGKTPRVLVATYHMDEWTRVDFMGAFAALKRSDGVTFEYHHMKRAPIHMARQVLADYALDSGYEWLVQLDDDATFPPDLIRRLLSHNKDVVCALAYQRKVPYGPCIFEYGPDGVMGMPLEGYEHTGLRRVDVSGFHCSLIRTRVFKRLREGTKDAEGKVLVPGTRAYYGSDAVGAGTVGEDFAACANLAKLKIPIYCDTDLISGHIGASIVVDENFRKDWIARGRPGTG